MKSLPPLLLGALFLGLAWVLLYGGRDTALSVFGLAGGAVALLPDRRRVREALRAAAGRYGLPPEWLDALGWVESRWRVDAVGDQGRSVGPTQIQRATLHNNGFTGSGDELLADPELAAEWTARLLLPGARNAEGRQLTRRLESLDDLAAWWNAGRSSFGELGPTHPTRVRYAPALAAAVDSVRAEEGLA